MAKLFGTSVHTNSEALAILLATAFAGASALEGALIVASFALGTGLHLACHWVVALAWGKGIDRMVLTRAGRIDYSGAPPGRIEEIVRTAAGPTMNAVCALAGYAMLLAVDVRSWPLEATLALRTFVHCSSILAALNFLPAIPLDGGLILRSILKHSLGEARATRVAAITSVVLMFAMATLGAVLLQPVLVYLAAVIAYDNWRQHLRGRQTRPDGEPVGS
jgi:Zn-dependent protease